MDSEKIILLLINIVGGAAVIGSYVLGLHGKTGGADALWGGVPAKVRPVYTVSMILSAIGYLAVLFYLFFVLKPGEVIDRWVWIRPVLPDLPSDLDTLRLVDAAHERLCE